MHCPKIPLSAISTVDNKVQAQTHAHQNTDKKIHMYALKIS